MTTTREKQGRLVEILTAWQQLESRSIVQCGDIADRTRNPVLRLVMEIIRRDSAMHHRVEQFVVESIEKEPVSLTVDDLEAVWGAIEAHVEAEREAAQLAAQAREALAGTQDVVTQYLLAYLEADEKKHDALLDALALIKRGMYRAA